MRLNPMYSVVYLWHLGHAYLLTRRYEDAAAALKGALDRNPDFLPAHILLAATYSESGHEDKARVEVAEILRKSPQTSLKVLRQKLPYKDPAVLERALDSLRKAGLK